MSPLIRIADAIALCLTPEQREVEQEAAVRRYLDRLDHNQWRDPVSGRIRPRVRQPAPPRSGSQRGSPQYWRR